MRKFLVPIYIAAAVIPLLLQQPGFPASASRPSPDSLLELLDRSRSVGSYPDLRLGSLVQEGASDAAVAYCRQLGNLRALTIPEKFAYVSLLDDQGKSGEATDLLEEMIHERPTDAHVLFAMGCREIKRRDEAVGMKHLLEAVSSDPLFAAAYLEIARTTTDTSKALECCGHVLLIEKPGSEAAKEAISIATKRVRDPDRTDHKHQ